MFAQLITSGTGSLISPTAICNSGTSPYPRGACFESGSLPVNANCFDNGYTPTEDGGCFFGFLPY